MTQNENSATVRLSDLIAPSFFSAHKAIINKVVDEILLKGGRGSTKSSFAAIEIILGIMSDPDANAVVLRKYGNTIRDSVHNTLLWATDCLCVGHLFKSTHSPAELTFLPTGQKIIMRGLDDPQKLKSIKVRRGYIKYLWFEEADEYNGMAEIRNVQQSVLRGGVSYIVFISYNPPNDPNAWVNKESKIEKKGRLIHESNYLQVDPSWLGQRFLDDANHLKIVDPLAYDHEYMGLAVGKSDRIVFHGKWEIKEFETPDLNDCYMGRRYRGADWGFANDPTTLVDCFVIEDGPFKDLYIEHETGGVGVENDEIPMLFRKVPEAEKWMIYADCSRPETISHVKNKGFSIEPCDKWTGSIEDGIATMKSFRRIYVHTRCTHTIEEFKYYQYKVDRITQEVLPVLVEKNDHYMDAIRYAIGPLIKRRANSFDIV